MANKIKKSKRIGIDARFYGPENKGLGRYTKEVVDRILARDGQNEYVIFLNPDNFENFQSASPRVKKVLVKVRWYTLAEQIIMPFLIWKEKVDLMHFLHFNVPLFIRKRFIVTIHDLILTRHPTQRASTLSPWIYTLKNLAYKTVIKSAVKRAKKIIAVSKYTKDDITKQFKVSADKIAVIYEGISSTLKSAARNTGQIDDKNVVLKYNIDTPYLLYVGSAYPHKNLEILIDTLPKLKEKNPELKLVLVGEEDYFYKRIKKYAAGFSQGQDIIFPGFIPDNQLISFYRLAHAYVFPSLHEGFGLPPLEAMQQGCVVASSNRTCLPEILGEAVLYFDPNDSREMQDQIERILTDNNLREELIAKGRIQAQKYSWHDCVEKILELYDSI
jgi:glycosyltransferase involved in cell wall biosynthesis